MSIEVCIGNEGYYAEGELRDAWITLPKTDEEIRDFLSANGLQDPEHEEIYISDYDGVPFGLNSLFGEYTSLDQLNLLAKLMEKMPEDAEKVDKALGCGIDEPESALGLMNWIVQADEIPYYSYDYDGIGIKDQWGQTCLDRFSAEENYGYTLLEMNQALKEALDNDNEAMGAFDVERYGKICAMNGGVHLGECGYVPDDDMPDEDRYSLEEIGEMVDGGNPGGGGPGAPALDLIPDDGADLDAEALNARNVSAALVQQRRETVERPRPIPER